MGVIRGIACLLLALWTVPVAFLAWLIGVMSCDESCDPTTGDWADDPDAMQWDVISASGWTAAFAVVVTLLLRARGRRRASLAALAVCATATVVLVALVTEAHGSAARGLALLLLTGPAVGLVAVRA